MRSLWLLVVAAGTAGCHAFSTVECSDGRTCPAGTVCDDGHGLCVQPDQLDACRGAADGSPCETRQSEGVCDREVCLEAICGDGYVLGAEQCDRANLGGQDCLDQGFYNPGALSCTAACTFDTSACTGICGDAVVNGPEQCDGGTSTCQARGFANGGTIQCNVICAWDTSTCSN